VRFRSERGSAGAGVRGDAATVIEADDQAGAAARPPTAGGELAPGHRLAGYEIQREIGRGGMGVVYRARHLHLGRTAALKVLTPELALNDSFRERFVRESRIAASLDHPGIVSVYDAGDAGDRLYIAMRFVAGVDLGDLLEPGPLQPGRAFEILGQVASALDAAHEAGLVHRDVKPANVLVAGQRAFLTDFGLVKEMNSVRSLTAAGRMVGTLDYVAPEQIRGEHVDGRADVYALGCVLFHALAGSAPYAKLSEAEVMYAHLQATPPRVEDLSLDLPPALGDVIAKALEKDPAERFQTCAELLDAARAAAGFGPVPGATRPAATESLLVVSDDPALRSLVAGALAGTRLDVVSAPDREMALSRAASDTPSAVLVMRRGDGPELCRDVRSRAPKARLLVALPRSASAQRGAALAAGADEVITWPFSGSQLLVKLRDLLGPEVLAR
jgi:serine/threonine-protein kinase